MAAELAETDRVRRDLVANVSHELRTPLTALQATLENIVDGVATADPETLHTMLAQVERLGRLVTQLLDLSRLEAGTVPLDRQDFAIEPVLAHAVREQKLHAPDVEIDDDGRGARTSRPTATPSASTRSSRTCSRTRSATRPPAARSRCGPAAARPA